MAVFLIAIFMGIVTGLVASSKGRSFWIWFLFGGLLAIVALPAALLMRPNTKTLDRRAIDSGEYVKCARCAELIRAEAQVCKHCGAEVDRKQAAPVDIAAGQY